MNRPSRRERSHLYNSLACVVKALEGQYTTIDLRNEAFVTGQIEAADGFMNINMRNVIFCDSKGNEFTFETFFVQARNIVYVHLPKKKPAAQLIEDYMNSVRIRMPVGKKQRTFKSIRAQKYQRETESLLAQGTLPSTSQQT